MVQNTTIQEYCKKLTSYINSLFYEYEITSLKNKIEIKNILEAMKYAVLDEQAKRIRPTLLFLIFSLVEQNKSPKSELFDEILAAGASIELIHSYSLIHDDLPCMDNDMYRRGKLTCHAKFGETTALLAGDALISMAFEVLSRVDKKIIVNKKCNLLAFLAKCSGIMGMVGGQFMDIFGQNKEQIQIKQLKTGSLFAFAAKAGAAISIYGHREEKWRKEDAKKILKMAEKFGMSLGIMFQIADDIKDGEESVDKNKKILKNYAADTLKILFQIVLLLAKSPEITNNDSGKSFEDGDEKNIYLDYIFSEINNIIQFLQQ